LAVKIELLLENYEGGLGTIAAMREGIAGALSQPGQGFVR
jgi:hypothetical protein